MAKSLVLVEIQSLSDALQLRLIRNSCRRFMTRNQGAISLWQQLWWYFWRYPNLPGRCYLAYQGPRVIGYGVLTIDKKDHCWISLGLSPAQRGKGWGKLLLAALIRTARRVNRQPIYLEVLGNNYRARSLYEDAGFAPVSLKGNVITMKL